MAYFGGMLLNGLIVLFFFSFTIFVHELGHFLVARRLGLKVLEFSIGFGPALWKKSIDGVIYKFAIIPLGGYVKLPQMDPTGASLSDDEKKEKLPYIAPWKRIAVGLAGVTCNMILAVIMACIVFQIGRPAEPRDHGTRVDFVDTNSVLFAKGLRAGDKIEAINDHEVENWDDVITFAALEPNVVLHVRRDKAMMPTIEFATDSAQKTAEIFFRDVEPVSPVIIGDMYTNWPAYNAGLRTGDRILAIDEVPVVGKSHMISVVSKSGGRTLRIDYERGGAKRTAMATPIYDSQLGRFRIGNAFQGEIVHPRPFSEIHYAGGAVFRLLHALTTARNAGRAGEAVGGAPEILYAFWHMARTGLIVATSFAVTLNVNLAIVNMLPFMVLDGGHICLALWEWIRRKPASPKFVSALWQAGAVCLITLMLLLTFRGIYRIHKWTAAPDGETAAEIQKAEKEAAKLPTAVPAPP
jgi:regulator of sigma E protease